MTDPDMTFEEFERLVARHGTNPALWPDPSLSADDTVRDWLATERALEARLQLAATPALSANFSDRVVGALPSTRSRWRVPGAVAAMLVAAVISVGVMQNGPTQGGTSAEPWMDFAEDAEFGDLYEWVMEG